MVRKTEAFLAFDCIWETSFFNSTFLSARTERHLQVRFKSVPLLWFPGSMYFSTNWSESEKLMQFVVISVSGSGNKEKVTIRCLPSTLLLPFQILLSQWFELGSSSEFPLWEKKMSPNRSVDAFLWCSWRNVSVTRYYTKGQHSNV